MSVFRFSSSQTRFLLGLLLHLLTPSPEGSWRYFVTMVDPFLGKLQNSRFRFRRRSNISPIDMTSQKADSPDKLAGAFPIADGSKIADWAKMTTQTFNSPSGPFQAHFYQNLKTGATHFADDFKAVFDHNGVWP